MIKVAALMPVKIDGDKSRAPAVWHEAKSVADVLILLDDGNEPALVDRCRWANEIVRVEPTADIQPWNDWVNRATLLARAAKFGCTWALWLDDDESLGPSLTQDRVRALCAEADKTATTCIFTRVRTAWDDRHWRHDGLFGGQRKPLLSANPFSRAGGFDFHFGPDKRLHTFPIPKGKSAWVDDYIIHWGMRNRALRERNVRKYQLQDPSQQWSKTPYDYLLDEDGLQLKPLNE